VCLNGIFTYTCEHHNPLPSSSARSPFSYPKRWRLLNIDFEGGPEVKGAEFNDPREVVFTELLTDDVIDKPISGWGEELRNYSWFTKGIENYVLPYCKPETGPKYAHPRSLAILDIKRSLL
jgi:hypothetical protein